VWGLPNKEKALQKRNKGDREGLKVLYLGKGEQKCTSHFLGVWAGHVASIGVKKSAVGSLKRILDIQCGGEWLDSKNE